MSAFPLGEKSAHQSETEFVKEEWQSYIWHTVEQYYFVEYIYYSRVDCEIYFYEAT